jgi:excisionase family DNA binding protein
MVAYVLEEAELQRRIKSALRVLAVGDTWLTPTEAATRARVSKSHFLRLVRTAKGPKHCGEGRLMRFRVSDIDSWVGSGFHEPECDQGGAAQSGENASQSKEPWARAARQRT